MDQLILLQFPQLERQCSRGCLGNQPLKLAEPLFSLDKMPQNERLVLSANKAHRGFDRTVKLSFGFHQS